MLGRSYIICHILAISSCQAVSVLTTTEDLALFKGILWQLYKLGLKVPSGRDENDGIGHLAELGSSWAGEAKMWPKIALRVGGRAENSVLGDGRSYKSTVLRDGRPQEKSTVLRDGRPWTRPSSNTVLFFRGRPSLNTVLFSPLA